jgi:iron transport multicopper oxidase
MSDRGRSEIYRPDGKLCGVYDLRFRYRFRLVSISCDANWKFSIDNHIMTIIEVDGTNAQPLNVDQIQIFAGQRYSFVVGI